jgi:hypothetical protein
LVGLMLGILVLMMFVELLAISALLAFVPETAQEITPDDVDRIFDDLREEAEREAGDTDPV